MATARFQCHDVSKSGCATLICTDVTHNGKTKFHLIHTWGWDHPALFHWESDDLIQWTAANGGTRTDDGKIMLMDGHDGGPVSPNAWAPEFTSDGQTGTFYLYWSSRIGDRQVHHYCTTKDWLTFSTPAVYFDPGFTAIDMTILKEGDTYYAYYKDERNGEKTIRCATSKSLDPRVQRFEGSTPLLPSRYIEVEGPEVFPAIGGKGWFLYFDKFNGDRGVSYTGCTDPSQHKWYPIPDDEIRNPTEVKHGSVEIILPPNWRSFWNISNKPETNKARLFSDKEVGHFISYLKKHAFYLLFRAQ